MCDPVSLGWWSQRRKRTGYLYYGVHHETLGTHGTEYPEDGTPESKFGSPRLWFHSTELSIGAQVGGKVYKL